MDVVERPTCRVIQPGAVTYHGKQGHDYVAGIAPSRSAPAASA